jgi:gamma-glutamyl-gamma-aminobutyrate hydrolase PuuD
MNSPRAHRPLVGITCGEVHNKDEPWSPVVFGQSRTYIDSVLQAGGTPVLLPLTADPGVLADVCDTLDGLLLAGGNDLSPSLYDQQPSTEEHDYSVLRDASEQIVLRTILEARKPILGICRGMQLLNVHFGGSLYQDIATNLPDAIDHNASTKLKTLVDLGHALEIAPGSKLAGIVGNEAIGANAHHHQAIDRLGDGIEAVAWASDSVVEAIEKADYPYMIGIQAHPESLTEVEPRWQQLFTSFVQASRTF